MKMRKVKINGGGAVSFFSSMSVTVKIVIFTSIFSILGFIGTALTSTSKPASIFALNESPLLSYIALRPLDLILNYNFWTLITHIFSHGNLFHLFINMFVLFSLGGLCERIIGGKRFFWFYLISGIFAGIFSAVVAGFFGFGIWGGIFGSPLSYMVGASGAIFGIAGLFVMLLPRLRFSIIFLPFFSLPAYIMVPLVLILTWVASYFAGLPIGNVAHTGGFLVGIVYGYYLRKKYRKKVMMLQRFFR